MDTISRSTSDEGCNMSPTELDLSDPREAFIASEIGDGAFVIWSEELPWHQGQDPCDRYVVGFIPSENGPEIFVACARHAYGRIEGGVIFRAPVTDVCHPGSPGGKVEAFLTDVKGIYDSAVVMENVRGEISHVARRLTHAHGVYLLRFDPRNGDSERLNISYARKEPHWKWPRAEVVWSVPFAQVIEWASRVAPTPAPVP
jgi:hypothetical protein